MLYNVIKVNKPKPMLAERGMKNEKISVYRFDRYNYI